MSRTLEPAGQTPFVFEMKMGRSVERETSLRIDTKISFIHLNYVRRRHHQSAGYLSDGKGHLGWSYCRFRHSAG